MRLASIGLVVMLAVGCGSGPRLLVAAGTTLVDSGFMNEVAESYTQSTGVEIDVLGEASAQILALARTGTVDVAITHAPDLERDFVDDGLASSSATVFVSRFVLAGPSGVALAATSPAEAFAEISARGGPFVGRQDGSGTAIVEGQIWRLAGVDGPAEPWYVATGQGMGLTLQVASERGAFVLSELGSFLSARDLELEDLGIVDSVLANPYTALGVAASDHVDLVDAFIQWLVSEPGIAAIELANGSVFDGVDVYRPAGK